jgi:hypothetical protein
MTGFRAVYYEMTGKRGGLRITGVPNSCYEDHHFSGSQALPGNLYFSGSARYLCGIMAYNGGGASRSFVPRRGPGTRSVARFFLNSEF